MFNDLIEWVEGVLGTYVPNTYDISQVVGEDEVTQTIIPSGLAGVDWRYIFTGVLLCITIWSVFRLLGILLERLGGR